MGIKVEGEAGTSNRGKLIPFLGGFSLCLFFVALIATLILGWLYFQDVQGYDQLLGWSIQTKAPSSGQASLTNPALKGPLWSFLVPQIGLLLGALFAGYVWS